MTKPVFQIGSVGHNLMQMHGIWHDHIQLFYPDGRIMEDDSAAGSGSPGASPFDNLVYFDFDGVELRLTNVHFRGRPCKAKTFTGKLIDDVLVFDSLGPGAYENLILSGGPGILNLTPRQINQACQVYMEPDIIVQTSQNTRIRHTVLYRHGEVQRMLTAQGTRLSPCCASRHPLDPRGQEGSVHEEPTQVSIWRHLVE